MAETLSPPSAPSSSNTPPPIKAFEQGIPMMPPNSADFAFTGGTEESYSKIADELSTTSIDYKALGIDNPFEGYQGKPSEGLARTGQRLDWRYLNDEGRENHPGLTSMVATIPENSWQNFQLGEFNEKTGKYSGDPSSSPKVRAKWERLRADRTEQRERSDHLESELTHELGALALHPEEIFKENIDLGRIVREKKEQDRRLRHYHNTAQIDKYRKRSRKLGEKTRNHINDKIGEVSNSPTVKGVFEAAHILSEAAGATNGAETLDEIDVYVPGASAMMELLQENIEGRKVDGQTEFLAALDIKAEAKTLYAKALLHDEGIYKTADAYRDARKEAIIALIDKHLDAHNASLHAEGEKADAHHGDHGDKHGHGKKEEEHVDHLEVAKDLSRYARAFESFEANWGDGPTTDEAAANYMEAILGGEKDEQVLAGYKAAMDEQTAREQAYVKMDQMVRDELARQLYPDLHKSQHEEHEHAHEHKRSMKMEYIVGGLGLALASGSGYAFVRALDFFWPLTHNQ